MHWNNLLIGVLLSLNGVVCLLLVFVVLMQRTKQEGLGAAFGGGITDSVFGAQTSTILTKATVWLATIFFILSIALGYLYAHRKTSSLLNDKLKASEAPAALPKPEAAPVQAGPVVTTPAVPAPAPEKK